MSALFDELTRMSMLSAYIHTGDERHLRDMPPIPEGPLMAFNDPAHLPKPCSGPTEPAPIFDVFDDDVMKCCIGGALTKPVQALLITLEHWDTIPPEARADTVKLELLKLKLAVKEEFSKL